MNNAIKIALGRVKKQIPHAVLDIVFVQKQSAPRPITLDQSIINTIVMKIVQPDCNLVGGRPTQIALKQSWHETALQDTSYINAGIGPYSIYRVPAEARKDAPITEVTHVQYPMPYGNGESYGRSQAGGTICDASTALLNSHTGGGLSPTPTAELLQGDLVRLHPGGYAHIDWVLNCKVGYDENMTNLNTSAIQSFARLVVTATKQYIYNSLIIDLDRGFIEGGAEVTSIKNIVEPWVDLEEGYQEELKTYFGANMLDVTTAAILLKHML